MKKWRAFTLIELLVVIAIIALLMAILMPTLRAAKDQAKKTVCTGHVKGLALAVRMYADDYDGKTHDSPNNGLWDNTWENPPVVREYGPNDDMAYWGIAYFPYAKNKKIFRCPSTKRVDDWPEWVHLGGCRRKSTSNTAPTASTNISQIRRSTRASNIKAR